MFHWITLRQKHKNNGSEFTVHINPNQVIFCQFWDEENRDKGYGEVVAPGGCFYVWSKEEAEQVRMKLGIG